MSNVEKAIAQDEVSFFGKKVTVKANFAFFARYKKLTGKGLLLKNGLGNDADAEEVGSLVWLAIGGEQSGMTLEAVLEQLTRDDLPEIVKLVKVIFDQSELTEAQKNAPAVPESSN